MLIGALGAMGSLANSLTPRQDGAHSRGHKQCSEPGRKKRLSREQTLPAVKSALWWQDGVSSSE